MRDMFHLKTADFPTQYYKKLLFIVLDISQTEGVRSSDDGLSDKQSAKYYTI